MFKPLLAAKAPAKLSTLNYPLFASPKLDGIRSIVSPEAKVLSRTLKPIPNKFIQKSIGLEELGWMDGELIVGSHVGEGVMQRSSSGVMSRDGDPDFKFYVFDLAPMDLSGLKPNTEYRYRHAELAMRLSKIKNPYVELVENVIVHDEAEALAYEEKCLLEGYEGIMLRSPSGLYKTGRSTVREGHLIKVKRFEDSEAEILGFIEEMENTNEQELDNLGRSKRSHKKSGMVPKGRVGTLILRDLYNGVEFECGTGLTHSLRQRMWDNQDHYWGEMVKYRFQPYGVKDKPRLPVFIGFRDPIDL